MSPSNDRLNASEQELVGLLLDANRLRRLIEQVPAHLLPTDEASAYRVANAVSDRLGVDVGGWKIGATATNNQQELGAASAVERSDQHADALAPGAPGPAAAVQERLLAARQLGSVALTLDILVPPLTLLLLLVGAAWLVTGVATLVLGLPALAWGIASANLVLLLLALVLAWHVFGRAVLPARALVLVVPYVLQKLRLYGGMALGSRSRGWVRTDRQGPKE